MPNVGLKDVEVGTPRLPAKELKMPMCPKCANNLTKRKSTMTYHCRRHGFVRKINTPNISPVSVLKVEEIKQ